MPAFPANSPMMTPNTPTMMNSGSKATNRLVTKTTVEFSASEVVSSHGAKTPASASSASFARSSLNVFLPSLEFLVVGARAVRILIAASTR